jgi:hypothetical protein
MEPCGFTHMVDAFDVCVLHELLPFKIWFVIIHIYSKRHNVEKSLKKERERDKEIEKLYLYILWVYRLYHINQKIITFQLTIIKRIVMG